MDLVPENSTLSHCSGVRLLAAGACRLCLQGKKHGFAPQKVLLQLNPGHFERDVCIEEKCSTPEQLLCLAAPCPGCEG